MLDDQKEVFKAARFIGMDNYGIGDCFIVNKDPENYSITQADLKKLNINLRLMLNNDPETPYFSITFVAGHGMSKESMQWLILNHFDAKTGFYQLHDTEQHVRRWSKFYMNCYFLAVFACCREIYDKDSINHSGQVGAKS